MLQCWEKKQYLKSCMKKTESEKYDKANENASNNKKRLIMIESEWLRDQIEKYEFIPKDCFADFSDVKNYKEMFELRKAIIEDAFTTKRNTILYN